MPPSQNTGTHDRASLRLNIEKMAHLSMQLGVSEEHLKNLADTVDKYYYTKELENNGKIRTIEPSTDELKRIQKLLNEQVLARAIGKLPDFFHGSRRGHSAFGNAAEHIGQPMVLKADLKNFFPKITNRMVYKAFTKLCRCSPDVARVLTQLTTYKGHVPQGAPTSSSVSTLVLYEAAMRMHCLAVQNGWNFTVYVDDLTFSGPMHLPKFKNLIRKIATEHGFVPNEKKMIASPRTTEQVVTGQKVNGHRPDATRAQRDGIFRIIRDLTIKDRENTLSKSDIQSLLGKIAHVRRANPSLARSMLYRSPVREWARRMKPGG